MVVRWLILDCVDVRSFFFSSVLQVDEGAGEENQRKKKKRKKEEEKRLNELSATEPSS